ncbi:STAS domain-containing protein [Streptomyces sp. NPDC048383]|uniref:STAS domain-containing protein n=1 Tax=Streptomyces sp. NPDC048383 TaxID=3155386 RepID=UPI0034255B16
MNSGEQRLIVHVGGEMDVDRAPMLAEALYAAIRQPGGADEIVVDVAELFFCDSSGLNALITAQHEAKAHGCHISLRAPQPQLRRLLELTGADAFFSVTDT